MREKVIKAAGCYLKDIKTLAVALSGGADSVALLDVMAELSSELGFSVLAAHFNHKLRGAESDRDEAFVRLLCEKKNIKLITSSGDVAAYAKKQKIGTELAARQMRYDFFETLKVDAVATAHTASDNLETVLFNLTRGSGIGGLCGIPVKRGKYIRPLILCTRADVEQYCKERELEFVTDSTNLSDDYTRNLIRHKIVPVLKEINPGVEENVINTSGLLSRDRDFIMAAAEEEYGKALKKTGLDAQSTAKLDIALKSRVVRLFCEEKTGISPDYSHTADLIRVAENGGCCSLGGGFKAYRQKNILKIAKADEETDFNVKILKKSFTFTKNNKNVNNLLLNNLLDCDKIAGGTVLRTRRQGDTIRLAGRGVTKTLKQIYNEKAIPLDMRKNLPVLADDKGVLWIAGIGVAERAAVTESSKTVYEINYEIIYGGNNKQ